MKKFLLITVVLALITALFAGCVTNTAPAASEPPENETSAADEPEAEDAAGDAAAQQETQSDEIPYAFEFKDLNGNVHKLSDYAGKPVYLKIWASWCGVCVSSLPEINEISPGTDDYHLLTVIAPGLSGEKSLEDFKAWYAQQSDTENIIVLVDEEAQIIYDFGVQAFPSQVFFDANGNFAGGHIGLMPKDQIDEEMARIAET